MIAAIYARKSSEHCGRELADRAGRNTLRFFVTFCAVLLFEATLALPQERGFKTIERGTGKLGDSPTEWSVTLADGTYPGHYIGSEVRKIGEGLGLAQSVGYYFAGIDGRTVHLYAIERQVGGREEQRLPILLPLLPDDTAVLTISPLYAKKSIHIRLKRNPDNSLAATVIGQ
jgi:hypothetical protein